MSDVELSRIAVIGSGSWGTALANLLAEKEGIDVDLWAREEAVYKEIRDKHTNQLFLPDVPLAPALKPVSSFDKALHEKQLVLIAAPSHVFREVLTGLKPHLTSGMTLMMATSSRSLRSGTRPKVHHGPWASRMASRPLL